MTDPAQYINGRTVEEQMNSLIGYVDTRSAEVATDAIASDMATLSQAVADAESAKDDAEAARDTAVSTVSDCVKKTPAAAQTITGYGLTVSAGITANVTGNLTGNVTGDVTGNVSGYAARLGTSTVGSTVRPIYLNGGTATLCNDMVDIGSPQTVTGLKTFTTCPVSPTIATGTNDTQVANGQKVINELNAYSAMVRTSGNQTIAGSKTLSSTLLRTDGATKAIETQTTMSNLDRTWTGNAIRDFVPFLLCDTNGLECCRLQYRRQGKAHTLYFVITKTDGTEQSIIVSSFTES